MHGRFGLCAGQRVQFSDGLLCSGLEHVRWGSHRDRTGWRDDGLRTQSGTPHLPCLYAARAGYEILNEVGIAAIRAKSQRLTQRIVEFAQGEDWPVNSPLDPARRGGSVSVGVPAAERVHAELDRRDVLCDWRPGVGLRLGPHFYTSDDDVERALAETKAIVDGIRAGVA